MKKIVIITTTIFLTLLFGGCSLSGNNNTSSNNMPMQDQNQTTSIEGSSISIQNFAFSPKTLTISKGVAVNWTNNDSAPHQIKSDTFDSKILNKGETFSFTFENVGTFDYSCAIHPSMTGKIIVQ